MGEGQETRGWGEMWRDPGALWQAWWRALGLRAPLSGDVTQEINASLIRGIGDQLGFININTSRAGDAELEQRIVTDVASYGRQLGRVLDALDVLIRNDERGELGDEDQRALRALETLHAEVTALKQRSAADRLDQLIDDIHALRQDPQANEAALRRIREALEDD